MNRNIFQAHLKHELRSIGQRVHLQHQSIVECCCLFEAKWPAYVQPDAINRELDQTIINDKFFDKRACMPIVMSIGLSKRTKDSFDILCKHLSERNPLTILELMEFVEAAAYLNYMQPHHPSIMLVMRDKHVKRLQKAEAAELRNALFTYLLDDTYKLPLTELPGYRLEITRLRKLLETKKEISQALKSKIVYRSFEEFATSQLLMDVAALSYRLQELNLMILQIPSQLIAGDYDKYDRDLAAYFTLANLNCQLLSQTANQLSVYLSTLKSLLDAFREKLIYEHMARRYQPLIDSLHVQKIYENLLRVNCH